MKPLTQTGAAHFVASFGGLGPTSSLSVEDYLLSSSGGSLYVEGTPKFGELRDCLLRDADRSLLLSLNCFTRALETLRASSVYWTVVGLYYSSFFSAKAILGMHGCWMRGAKNWIEVIDANPGKQRLIHKTTSYGLGGSHKVTWRAFYRAMAPLRTWLKTPHAQLAATPVNANETWLIDARNEVNYDAVKAFKLKQDFESSFDPANMPNCFGGKFRTMFDISVAFVLFARDMAKDFHLSTDVYAPHPTRRDWCQTLITPAQAAAILAFASTYHPQIEY